MRLFEAARPGRDRVLLQTAYACGLRIGELVHLQVADIDSGAHGRGGAAGQGSEGSSGAAVGAAAGGVAALVADAPFAAVAVPGTDAGSAAAPIERAAYVSSGVAAGQDHQAGDAAHAAALVRHAPARSRRRCGDAATLARPRRLSTTAHYLHVSRRHLAKTPSLLDLIAVPLAFAAEGQP